jgi:hypothetical protein
MPRRQFVTTSNGRVWPRDAGSLCDKSEFLDYLMRLAYYLTERLVVRLKRLQISGRPQYSLKLRILRRDVQGGTWHANCDIMSASGYEFVPMANIS